ncbi:hypothetical protein PR048_023727 [Dryococelus australis]|uniref:FP protein C-terminal domain-containing protein n=1 Tax=Dryococelus australis TaxID=614101 RepID=A0ABQ9GUZ7_9NEOP|nr:hypothetical protein PR048_023727 [Dryococelus australis]
MASDADDKCGVYAKLAKNVDNAVFCECVSLSEESYRVLQNSKSPYKCATCKSPQSTTVEQFCATVKSLQDCVEALKKKLESKIENFNTVGSEFGKMKAQQKTMSEKLKRQTNDINWLYDSLNECEQYSKNHDGEIKGMPKSENENCLALVKKKKIDEVAGCNIDDLDMDGCRRLQKKLDRKDEGPLYTSKLNIPAENRQVYVDDHLTAYNKKLLAKAQEGNRSSKLDAAWANKGKIFVKKSQNDKPTHVRVIWSLEDLCGSRREERKE